MPFNVNTFRQSLAASSYLQNNKFKIIITPPTILQGKQVDSKGQGASVQNILNMHQFRVESVRVPGVSLLTADNVPKYGIGVVQKFPTNAQLNEIGISVLSDGFGYAWQYWYHWINGIFGFAGGDSVVNANQSNTPPSYQAEYKDQYSTMMNIIVYDNYGNPIQRFNLFEAFPTSLREVGLGWGDTGQLLKLNITIAFTEFTIEGSQVESNMLAAGKATRKRVGTLPDVASPIEQVTSTR